MLVSISSWDVTDVRKYWPMRWNIPSATRLEPHRMVRWMMWNLGFYHGRRQGHGNENWWRFLEFGDALAGTNHYEVRWPRCFQQQRPGQISLGIAVLPARQQKCGVEYLTGIVTTLDRDYACCPSPRAWCLISTYFKLPFGYIYFASDAAYPS